MVSLNKSVKKPECPVISIKNISLLKEKEQSYLRVQTHLLPLKLVKCDFITSDSHKYKVTIASWAKNKINILGEKALEQFSSSFLVCKTEEWLSKLVSTFILKKEKYLCICVFCKCGNTTPKVHVIYINWPQ